MKKAIILSAALAYGMVASAVVSPAEVTTERYPDADAVLVDETERVTYRPDGTYESVAERWVKILTEKGRRENRVITLDYSKRYGEAAVMYVGIAGPDGVEREIDVSSTTSESTDNSSMSSNIYDPLDRTIVCTVPGLKVGDVLHIKTRRKALKARCEGKWADISVMEWTLPIVRSRYEVVAPKELPIARMAVRNPLGNVTIDKRLQSDGSTVHTFTATNSPQAFRDPDMPPLYTQIQNIRVSTARDWPEISKWYWGLCEPHLAKTNAAIVAKVAELGRDVRRIFTFVSQEIRYMGLTMEDKSPGYAPHDVDITFDNRYGVCRDKAALLVAMLRLAGCEAYPVIIHIGAKLDPEVPQPFFNHAIVAAKIDGEMVLMDPTNENAKDYLPAYESDKSYLVCRPEGDVLRTSPVPSPDLNRVRARTKGTLFDDGSLFFESDISFDGINDTAYRSALVRMSPRERVDFFRRVVLAVVSGAELMSCTVLPDDMRDTDSPLSVSVKARLPEALVRGETRDEMIVPFVASSLGVANFLLSGSTSLEKRRFPLVTDSTAGITETVEIALGESVGEPEAVEPDDVSSPGYSFKRSFSVSNDVLTASRALSISCVEFSPEAYNDLRESIQRVERAERRKMAFSHDRLANANTRTLFSSSETDIFSDRSWVTTNTLSLEVLSYQGKRQSAERTFSFNPSVGYVELVSAVVSNKDGSVKSVTDREKNVMDCRWAASAPRYPASKQLVVNFPAVEIGSVVSYTVVYTVTNSPLPFYDSFLFDSTRPVDRVLVRVNDWRREVISPRRVPSEPSQPPSYLWRDCVTVSSNRFEEIDLQVRSLESDLLPRPLSVRGIRDWMSKNVRIAGPSLYELPLADQLTDPETVLKERYASRLDYIRTMCSLLRGAGYEADVVFAASNADRLPESRERAKSVYPSQSVFSHPVCRVKERTGGFLGFGGEEKVYFIGTENHYAPIGPTGFNGSDYFDPSDASFGVVTVPDASFADFTHEESEVVLRENGDADVSVSLKYWGGYVAGIRKTYSEILPEERGRKYQELLGSISQSATATSDLETDVESYPAECSFSCYIPGYATLSGGDTMTLELSSLLSSIPALPGGVRRTPFVVPSASPQSERTTVRFPEGYTEVEHLPQSFVFADPSCPSARWLVCKVGSSVVDGCLTVTLEREIHLRADSFYPPDAIELIRDRSRIAGSVANRTITVRRPAPARQTSH